MKNAVVWSEIAVTDLKRATAFYEKLLDGKLRPESFGPFRIALFPHAADGVGGCLVHGEGYEPSAKGTLTYLAATPGIDAALERARAAGAKVLMPKPLMRRADRLFRIVQYLRGRRLTTAAFIAGRLGVSLRTVYRDVRELSLSGVPIEGEAGVGYRLKPGFDIEALERRYPDQEGGRLADFLRAMQSGPSRSA